MKEINVSIKTKELDQSISFLHMLGYEWRLKIYFEAWKQKAVNTLQTTFRKRFKLFKEKQRFDLMISILKFKRNRSAKII